MCGRKTWGRTDLRCRSETLGFCNALRRDGINDGDYSEQLTSDTKGAYFPRRREIPSGWWQAFWTRFEDNVGLDRDGALDLLRELGVVAWRWVLGVPRECGESKLKYHAGDAHGHARTSNYT
jgi:hypothetical protein